MSAAAINCFKFSFLDGKRKRIKNLRLSSKNPAKNRTFTNRKKMPFLLEKKSDGRIAEDEPHHWQGVSGCTQGESNCSGANKTEIIPVEILSFVKNVERTKIKMSGIKQSAITK